MESLCAVLALQECNHKGSIFDEETGEDNNTNYGQSTLNTHTPCVFRTDLSWGILPTVCYSNTETPVRLSFLASAQRQKLLISTQRPDESSYVFKSLAYVLQHMGCNIGTQAYSHCYNDNKLLTTASSENLLKSLDHSTFHHNSQILPIH